MTTAVVQIDNDAPVLPEQVLQELTWRNEMQIVFERHDDAVVLRPKKYSAEEIADIACIHLLEHVGDATAVKMPLWQDGKWRVEVVLSYRPETIGFLTYSSDGALIESESDSPKQLKGIAS